MNCQAARFLRMFREWQKEHKWENNSRLTNDWAEGFRAWAEILAEELEQTLKCVERLEAVIENYEYRAMQRQSEPGDGESIWKK